VPEPQGRAPGKLDDLCRVDRNEEVLPYVAGDARIGSGGEMHSKSGGALELHHRCIDRTSANDEIEMNGRVFQLDDARSPSFLRLVHCARG
jgi:hypothetical protein